MARYRLTHAAQADIVSILLWSHDQFGEEARKRYEALITTAIRDAATRSDEVGWTVRPELGDGVFSWHLAQSRTRSPGGMVHRPRHFLICRRDDEVLVIGRVLHDATELRRYLDAQHSGSSRRTPIVCPWTSSGGSAGPPRSTSTSSSWPPLDIGERGRHQKPGRAQEFV